MNDFSNRIDAQRTILSIVNRNRDWNEELCGLSLNAIQRWTRVNNCLHDGPLTTLLINISKALFLLAVRSQEQISEDYQRKTSDLAALTDELKALLGQSEIAPSKSWMQ